jgi:hypothetical protein
MSKIAYTLMCIIAIPIMIEMDYVLTLWLNSDIPTYTHSFANLTIIATMIGIFNTPVTQMIHASGQMKKYQLASSMVICSILPISWLFLKLGYEATCVFVVTIVIMIINQAVSLKVLHSIFKFSFTKYVRDVVVPCIIITVIPLFVVSSIGNVMGPSMCRFIVVAVVNILIVGILFYITLNSSEKQIIQSYVVKIKNKIC